MPSSAKAVAAKATPSANGANPSYDPKFKVPCTAGWEFITPDKARDMLAAGNRQNREVRRPPVAQLRGALDRQEWFYDSTDGIGLAHDGAVVNGQHRLTTIAEGEQGVWCLVLRNVRPEVVQVIDQGIPRSLSQTLAIMGGFAEPNTTSTAVKWLYRMVHGLEKHVPGSFKMTVQQGLELLAEHPHLEDSLDAAGSVRPVVPSMSKGALAAYHYTFASVDPDMADEFFARLASGVHVGQNEPVYALRERFIANLSPKVSDDKKLKEWEAAHFLVTAWEATRAKHYITSRDLRFVRAGSRATSVAVVGGVPWLGTSGEEEATA